MNIINNTQKKFSTYYFEISQDLVTSVQEQYHINIRTQNIFGGLQKKVQVGNYNPLQFHPFFSIFISKLYYPPPSLSEKLRRISASILIIKATNICSILLLCNVNLYILISASQIEYLAFEWFS